MSNKIKLSLFMAMGQIIPLFKNNGISILWTGNADLLIRIGEDQSIECKAFVAIGIVRSTSFIVAREADKRIVPDLDPRRIAASSGYEASEGSPIRNHSKQIAGMISKYFNLRLPVAYLQQDVLGNTDVYKIFGGSSLLEEHTVLGALGKGQTFSKQTILIRSVGAGPVVW